MIETLRKAMDKVAENIGCLARTGTVISDPAVRVGKEYLEAPAYAGKPEGTDFTPDKQNPFLGAYRKEVLDFLESQEPLPLYIQGPPSV